MGKISKTLLASLDKQEKALQKKFNEGKITKKKFHEGLSKIGTKFHAADMKARASKTRSMSSSKW
jgi:hypothetical protein